MLGANLEYFNVNSDKILIWCAKNKVKDFKLIKETLTEKDNDSLLEHTKEREWFIETEKLLFYITERKSGCSSGVAKIDVYVKDGRHITKHNVKNIMKNLVEVTYLFRGSGTWSDSEKRVGVHIDEAFFNKPCIKDKGIQLHIANIIDEACSIYWTEEEKERKSEKEAEEKDLVEKEKRAIEAFYGKTYSE